LADNRMEKEASGLSRQTSNCYAKQYRHRSYLSAIWQDIQTTAGGNILRNEISKVKMFVLRRTRYFFRSIAFCGIERYRIE